MPIRQPNGIWTPTLSPASISDVARVGGDGLAAARERRPCRPGRARRPCDTANRSRCRRSRDARRGPDPLGVVEHALRPARPGLALAPVGHLVGQPGQVEPALGPRRPHAAAGSRRGRVASSASSAANITSDSVGAECTWTTSVIWSRRASVRSIDITGVMPEPAVRNNTDAGAGSGMTKLPCGAASRTIVPGATPPTRWRRQEALGHRLDRDGDGACSPVTGRRRQRVRPPPPAAVDQHADADVLAGLVVEVKSPPRLDHQRRRVDGLAADLDHAAAQFARRPQRIGQLQVVVGQQRRGDPPGDRAQRVPAGMLLAPATAGRMVSATFAAILTAFLAMTAPARLARLRSRESSADVTYGTVTYAAVANVEPQSSSSRNGSSWGAYQARSWSCASPTVNSASSSPRSAASIDLDRRPHGRLGRRRCRRTRRSRRRYATGPRAAPRRRRDPGGRSRPRRRRPAPPAAAADPDVALACQQPQRRQRRLAQRHLGEFVVVALGVGLPQRRRHRERRAAQACSDWSATSRCSIARVAGM